MHITRVELKDIKSHEHFVHDFLGGTTAIIGDNGSGKTTIIEAIGWTIFDLLDYKKDDFVRRGAKKGIARVTFESGLDERQYLVHRDTKTGYYIFDPRLENRIVEKKEDVQRFLRKHLGVDPGTDLEAIYRRAIGVPQGTFTSIFLDTASGRKLAFDKLLKVEEYRTSSDKLLSTINYLKRQITNVNENIARAEGELITFDDVRRERDEIQKRCTIIESEIKNITKSIKKKGSDFERYEAQEVKIQKQVKGLERLQREIGFANTLHSQKLEQNEKANAALKIITENKKDFEKHIESKDSLRALESKRQLRETIRDELRTIENGLTAKATDHEKLADRLKEIRNAHDEIKIVEPKTHQQTQFEKELVEFRELKTKAGSAAKEHSEINKQVEILRVRFRENRKKLKEAEKEAAKAKNRPELEKQNEKIRRQLANFRAELSRDEEFQKQARDGLCPILTEKCLNLKQGQTLDGFLNSRFSELKTEIKSLKIKEKETAQQLQQSRRAENTRASLPTLKRNIEEIEKDGKALSLRSEKLKARLDSAGNTDQKIKELEYKLSKLDNPKARLQYLESKIKDETETKQALAKLEQQTKILELDFEKQKKSLRPYKTLDQELEKFSKLRDETEKAHRNYVANEELAKSAPKILKELALTRKELDKLEDDLKTAEKELKKSEEKFDRKKYESKQNELKEIDKKLSEYHVELKIKREREGQLTKRLNDLKSVQERLEKEKKENDRLEEIRSATSFVRSTLKESGPRVAKNYVYHVSVEANQVFREITGNMERTLSWSEDYEILLEENGYKRPFINLSGGEQMAAAMAVRLALLTQLSDIRLAFFDEPTMNMDEERRERLAEQIERINLRGKFDQLFVISHDDTFEGYVDTVVTIDS